MDHRHHINRMCHMTDSKNVAPVAYMYASVKILSLLW